MLFIAEDLYDEINIGSFGRFDTLSMNGSLWENHIQLNELKHV